MPTVVVKPELLRWAIDRSGLSMDELLTKFPKLDEWTTGDRLPTFRQLEQFARTTRTPFGALFLHTPPRDDLPIPGFRTKNDHPLKRYSPNLLDTIQTMQQRQLWLREWLLEEGVKPLDFVGTANPTINSKSLAQRIRHRLDLDADWAESPASWEDALQTLRKAIERIGVGVFSNGVVGLNKTAA